jgi:hypothetical protein
MIKITDYKVTVYYRLVHRVSNAQSSVTLYGKRCITAVVDTLLRQVDAGRSEAATRHGNSSSTRLIGRSAMLVRT